MASTTELVTESVSDLTKEKVNHEEKEEKRGFKSMTMKERGSYVKDIITIEPLLACYLMASVICIPALNNLEFEKGCLANLKYNATVCNSMLDGTYLKLNFTAEADAVQNAIIEMHSWQQPLQSVMPVILVLFLGSYSDRHQIRKPFLLVPILGEFFAVAGCILSVIFMKEWSLGVLGFMQTVLPSFFGGSTMIIMAAFAYIADVSTLKMRTLRIGIVQIVLNVCTPIFQSFSGILFAKIGYIGVLSIGAVLFLMGLLYGLFWVKEPKRPVVVEKKISLIKDMFDPRHAIETFKIFIKRVEGNNRMDIILIVIILFIFTGVSGGEGSVFFLFTVKAYQWTAVEFSYFGTVNTVVHLVGSIIALPLFTKLLKLHDLIIVIISFMDKILCNIVFTIFVTPIGLYVGTVVSLITAIGSIAIRSQATKVVSEDDLGKAQSVFAIVEAIAPAVIIPIYNQGIYSITLDSFPSAFFLLGVFLYAFGIAILFFMYIRDRRRPAPPPKKEMEANGLEMENGKHPAIVETTHI